jgi:hypothetical protein
VGKINNEKQGFLVQKVRHYFYSGFNVVVIFRSTCNIDNNISPDIINQNIMSILRRQVPNVTVALQWWENYYVS